MINEFHTLLSVSVSILHKYEKSQEHKLSPTLASMYCTVAA